MKTKRMTLIVFSELGMIGQIDRTVRWEWHSWRCTVGSSPHIVHNPDSDPSHHTHNGPFLLMNTTHDSMPLDLDTKGY
jgi:hypothetical protein